MEQYLDQLYAAFPSDSKPSFPVETVAFSRCLMFIDDREEVTIIKMDSQSFLNSCTTRCANNYENRLDDQNSITVLGLNGKYMETWVNLLSRVCQLSVKEKCKYVSFDFKISGFSLAFLQIGHMWLQIYFLPAVWVSFQDVAQYAGKGLSKLDQGPEPRSQEYPSSNESFQQMKKGTIVHNLEQLHFKQRTPLKLPNSEYQYWSVGSSHGFNELQWVQYQRFKLMYLQPT